MPTLHSKRKRPPGANDEDPLRLAKRPKEAPDLDPVPQINGNKGFCKLPEELIREIIRFYPSIGDTTHIAVDPPQGRKHSRRRHRATSSVHNGAARCLPILYLERLDVLRALRATCTAYSGIFRPLLWESLDICFPSRRARLREGDEAERESLHRNIGEAMLRKSSGLLENPGLATTIRTVNVIFTRYNVDSTLPVFARCLRLMPNLQTIHVLDANSQMPNATKRAFNEDVILPSVRTLIIPAACHGLLRSCPNVERVWCNQGDPGKKFVTVIKRHCKSVVEVRGFLCEREVDSMKWLVKGLPNIEILEVEAPVAPATVSLLKGLKDLRRLDVRIERVGQELEDSAIQRTIREVTAVLHGLSRTKDAQLRLVTRSSEGLDVTRSPQDTTRVDQVNQDMDLD